MQTISTNRITQTKHGQYNAVDIGPSPDPDYYAPEDGTITSWGDSGTCGLRLVLEGASGRHGFCHNEKTYVTVGQTVKRGQKLGKMGYTGYTEPSGPGGRHVHWVILKNGVYVYPPSLVNETFKQGDDMASTVGDTEIDQMSWAYFGYGASQAFIDEHRGKESNTFERFMFSHPVAVGYRKQIGEWRQAAGAGVYISYSGEPLYTKKKG